MTARVVKSPLRVLGTGSALPGPAVSTAELLQRLEERFGVAVSRKGTVIARRMGMLNRHICRDFASAVEIPRAGDSNPELAARALRSALALQNLGPNTLSYLIGHTTSPHTGLPPNIAWVADHLDYRNPYVELRQACTGFANALQLAQALLQAPEAAPVAIVGSETGSIFFDPRQVEDDPGQLVNLVQMGDGAGAIVLGGAASGAVDTIEMAFFGTLGPGYAPGFSLGAGGSGVLPNEGAYRRAVFEHHYADIKEQGPCLFEQGLCTARSAGIDPQAVDWIIPQQVNARLPTVIATRFGLDPGKCYVDADQVGNLGSASIWVALHRLRSSGRLQPGQTVLALGAEATKYMYGGFLYRHQCEQNLSVA
jgi:3-oxoacyl-[acyl-carrier-protein] synthase III